MSNPQIEEVFKANPGAFQGDGTGKKAENSEPIDVEFLAMNACVQVLKSLPQETKQRVLDYLLTRFKVTPSTGLKPYTAIR